jgi:hypothetical protein
LRGVSPDSMIDGTGNQLLGKKGKRQDGGHAGLLLRPFGPGGSTFLLSRAARMVDQELSKDAAIRSSEQDGTNVNGL